MLFPLSILFGVLVGFSLGLTGGGGSLLAVPLLVYGLSIEPRQAFGISLAAVGSTALIAVIRRIAAGQVDLPVGITYAAAGMLAAPLGTWVASLMADRTLLSLFSAIMIFVSWKMWPGRAWQTENREVPPRTRVEYLLILGCGIFTGFISGMFGVGGGFVIVPSLVLISHMPIHRAVATSLLVIALISISGVTAHFIAGRGIPLWVTVLFIIGGAVGITLGSKVGRRLSGPALQKVFAVGLVAIAIYVVGRSTFP